MKNRLNFVAEKACVEACAVGASKKHRELPRNSGHRKSTSGARAKNIGKHRAKWKAPKRPRAKHWKLPSENALRQNQGKGAARAKCYFCSPRQKSVRAKHREFPIENVRRAKTARFHPAPAGPPQMCRNCSGPSAVRKNAPQKAWGRNPRFPKSASWPKVFAKMRLALGDFPAEACKTQARTLFLGRPPAKTQKKLRTGARFLKLS